METLRYHGTEGPLVYDDETGDTHMPTQDDMDKLLVGEDFTDEEWNEIED